VAGAVIKVEEANIKAVEVTKAVEVIGAAVVIIKATKITKITKTKDTLIFRAFSYDIE